MRKLNKFGLLLALSVAAMAVAAVPAFATATITATPGVVVSPAGDIAASSPAADLQSNDTTITITCNSTSSGTVAANGTGVIEALDFNTDDCTGLCTADTLPTGVTTPDATTFSTAMTETVDTADNDATVTVDANTIDQVITCGAPIGDCGFSPPGDVSLNATEGAQTLAAVDVRLNRTSGNILACGTDGTWNATYSLTAPAGGLTLAPATTGTTNP